MRGRDAEEVGLLFRLRDHALSHFPKVISLRKGILDMIEKPTAERRLSGSLIILTLLVFLAPASLWAQMPGPVRPGVSPPKDAIHGGMMGGAPMAGRTSVQDSDKGGKAKARVQVLRKVDATESGPTEPAKGVRVALQWRAPRSEAPALSWNATSGEEGWADFGEVDVLSNPRRFELYAIVEEGGVRHVSRRLFPEAGKITGEVEMLRVSGDTDDVRGVSLTTVLAMPEGMNEHPSSYGHIQVQQLYQLEASGWMVYDTSLAMSSSEARGVPINLPIDAVGPTAQMVGGAQLGQAEVADSMLFYRGVIYPNTESRPPTTIAVQYYLKVSGPAVDFEQPIERDWAALEVVVVRETDLPDTPLLDIVLDAPQFAEQSDVSAGLFVQGQKVRAARGLALSKGDELHFRVDGLPYPENNIPKYLAILVVLLLVGGTFLGIWESRRAKERAAELERGGRAAMDELDEQIEALFGGLTVLAHDRDQGEVSDMDFDVENQRLKTRIALLEQRRDQVRGMAEKRG